MRGVMYLTNDQKTEIVYSYVFVSYGWCQEL